MRPGRCYRHEPTQRVRVLPVLHRCSTYVTGKMAEWTGLEPATPGVTGRYSNQLNYHSEYP